MANAKLVAELYANTGRFERDMRRAKGSLTDFGSAASLAGKAVRYAIAAATGA